MLAYPPFQIPNHHFNAVVFRLPYTPPMSATTTSGHIASGLVLAEPRRFERRQFDLPEVALNDGILRIEACGLCGTDHEQYTGLLTSHHAFIPGHEVVGVIEQVGDSAAQLWGVPRDSGLPWRCSNLADTVRSATPGYIAGASTTA